MGNVLEKSFEMGVGPAVACCVPAWSPHPSSSDVGGGEIVVHLNDNENENGIEGGKGGGDGGWMCRENGLFISPFRSFRFISVARLLREGANANTTVGKCPPLAVASAKGYADVVW